MSREPLEEAKIRIASPETSIRVVDAETTTELTNDLILGVVDPSAVSVETFEPSFEVSERMFWNQWSELPPMAFSIHEMWIKKFFGMKL
jgi:hypothetical protein